MKSLNDFPKVDLGIFPTPIHRLNNISRLLGTNVWIKRDDLTGIGLGGNKVRKLRYLLADAKAKGAEVVFTTGGAQSNHAMLTAAACLQLGLKPILILKERGVTARKGNQLLEYLMRNRGRVVSKNTILEHVWDYDFDPHTNVVEARVCRLREKIDRASERKLISTVRGFGYVLGA